MATNLCSSKIINANSVVLCGSSDEAIWLVDKKRRWGRHRMTPVQIKEMQENMDSRLIGPKRHTQGKWNPQGAKTLQQHFDDINFEIAASASARMAISIEIAAALRRAKLFMLMRQRARSCASKGKGIDTLPADLCKVILKLTNIMTTTL
jgi:hypothetical protein